MNKLDLTGPNADQIDFWNNDGGQHFVKYQTALNNMLDRFGEKVMDATGVNHGEVVLDIGCGCGDTTLELARRVGSTGEAVGVDISEIMLARAEDMASHGDATNVFFEQADVETGVLHRDSFDLAFSRFGIMFFANPVAAFKNVHRVLHERGRIAFACWQPISENAWIGLQLQVVAPLLEGRDEAPPPDPNAPGPFSLGDPDRVREIMQAAGFSDIKIEAYAPDVALFGLRDIDEVVEFAMEIGPARALLEGQTDSVRQAAHAAIRTAYEPYLTDEGVVMNSAAWIVSGRKS